MTNGNERLPQDKCDHIDHMIGYNHNNKPVCGGCGIEISRERLRVMSLKGLERAENMLKEHKGEKVIGI